MYEIKKLHVMPLALMTGFIVGSIYLIMLLFFMFIIVPTGLAINDLMPFSVSSSAGAFLVMIPFMAGGGFIMGFVIGGLVALIYNLWSDWVGGIKMDIYQIAEAVKTATSKTTRKK